MFSLDVIQALDERKGGNGAREMYRNFLALAGAKRFVSSLQKATQSSAGEASAAAVFFCSKPNRGGPIYFFAGIISASMVMEISSPIIPGPYVIPKSWRVILELALTPTR
jgi:hypothetical protein